VIARKLEKNNVYFIILFSDKDMDIPVIQTLVYQEKKVAEDGSSFLYLFNEIKPHDDESMFFVQEDDIEKLVVDKKGLVEKLSQIV